MESAFLISLLIVITLEWFMVFWQRLIIKMMKVMLNIGVFFQMLSNTRKYDGNGCFQRDLFYVCNDPLILEMLCMVLSLEKYDVIELADVGF